MIAPFSRPSRYLEPNIVSIEFASLKLYNFTLDFLNLRFLETPDNSNQFWLPWDKLTTDNSNLRKFPNHLMRMSITFSPDFCMVFLGFYTVNFLCFRGSRVNIQAVLTDEATRKSVHEFWTISQVSFLTRIT